MDSINVCGAMMCRRNEDLNTRSTLLGLEVGDLAHHAIERHEGSSFSSYSLSAPF